jgi:hypothetical protein
MWKMLLGLPIYPKRTRRLRNRSWREGDPDRWLITIATFLFFNHSCLVMHFTWTFSFLKKIIQILNAKPPQPLTHKSKLGLSSGSSNLCSSVANKMKKEERKVCYFCQTS